MLWKHTLTLEVISSWATLYRYYRPLLPSLSDRNNEADLITSNVKIQLFWCFLFQNTHIDFYTYTNFKPAVTYWGNNDFKFCAHWSVCLFLNAKSHSGNWGLCLFRKLLGDKLFSQPQKTNSALLIIHHWKSFTPTHTHTHTHRSADMCKLM